MTSGISSAAGIDTSRIYFREEIAALWGFEYLESDQVDDADRLRKWFKRHFLDKGLRVLRTGGRVMVHGFELSEFVRHNSGRLDE